MIIEKRRYKKFNFLLSYFKMLSYLGWEKIYDLLLFKTDRREIANMLPVLMDHKKAKTLCGSCTICQSLCPEGSIVLKNRKLQIDLMTCSYCQYCVSACPENLLELQKVDFNFLPIENRFRAL